MDKNNIELINKNNFFNKKIIISAVEASITNKNFVVTDGFRKYCVRINDDIQEHLVLF